MGVRFEAKTAPHFIPPDIQIQMEAALDRAALTYQREMMYYPPWRPWAHPPPKTGPRAGGRRTGAYGRGWAYPGIQRKPFERTLSNNVEYAQYVGGNQQAWFHKGRWPLSKTIAERLKRETRLILTTRTRTF